MSAVRAALVAGVILMSPPRASAQCLTGGDIEICDDLTTGATLGERVGGTLDASGFTVDADGDHLVYDLGGLVVRGTVRFLVTGVSPRNLDADDHILVHLHEIRGTYPEAESPECEGGGCSALVLRVGGAGGLDPPVNQGRFNLDVWTGPMGFVRLSPQYEWRDAGVYEIEIEFGPDELVLRRDGDEVFRTATTRAGMTVRPYYRFLRIPMPGYRPRSADPAVGSTYRLVTFTGEYVMPPPLRDAGPSDAGSLDPVPADAGSRIDATTPSAPDAAVRDARPPDPRDASSPAAGCACSVTPRRAGLPLAVLAGLLAVLLAAYRRV